MADAAPAGAEPAPGALTVRVGDAEIAQEDTTSRDAASLILTDAERAHVAAQLAAWRAAVLCASTAAERARERELEVWVRAHRGRNPRTTRAPLPGDAAELYDDATLLAWLAARGGALGLTLPCAPEVHEGPDAFLRAVATEDDIIEAAVRDGGDGLAAFVALERSALAQHEATAAAQRAEAAEADAAAAAAVSEAESLTVGLEAAMNELAMQAGTDATQANSASPLGGAGIVAWAALRGKHVRVLEALQSRTAAAAAPMPDLPPLQSLEPLTLGLLPGGRYLRFNAPVAGLTYLQHTGCVELCICKTAALSGLQRFDARILRPLTAPCAPVGPPLSSRQDEYTSLYKDAWQVVRAGEEDLLSYIRIYFTVQHLYTQIMSITFGDGSPPQEQRRVEGATATNATSACKIKRK
jgi:hypothetical protein